MTNVTRALLISLATSTLSLAALDVAFGAYARSHFIPALRLRDAQAAGDGCVVTIGDSRMAAGVDAATMQRAASAAGATLCVASLGIGALGLEGQALALRQYLGAASPRLVVLGIGGDVLPRDPPDPAQLVGNAAATLAWSRVSDVTLLYPGFPTLDFDRGFRFSLARTNALTTYQSLVWSKVGAALKQLAGTAAKGETNTFGMVGDMRDLAAAFEKEDRSQLALFRGQWRHSVWFEQIRALTRARDARLVVVLVPMPSAYGLATDETDVRDLEAEYRDWLREDLAAHDDVLLDLRGFVDDRHFADGLHLDREGAAAFSEELARQLAPML